MKGVADAANVPGMRLGSVSWIDAAGDLWLFGGEGADNVSIPVGYLNDLWKFDGVNWTWVSGNYSINNGGTCGVKGVADAANVPGARKHSVSWIDAAGDLWLFGGFGYDNASILGGLNDLWVYSP